ncbi:hypothetical protein [Arthrobacter sp. H16F315]|uniref:hypothetical protein n=1 Tax=Arthrobacter sp. H16F315 TaxID=2955314 RepID=UPI002097C94C|nr:hypothetical protein [Arthrobacter sp. H16F315]MDD1476441.1 hypothetical protein [Arthrobacter sp. H16F315]
MSTPEESGTAGEQHLPERRSVTVRRAPKYVPFLVLGGLLGFGVAAFLAYGLPGDESYDASAVFGFFMILCGAGGIIVGGVAALILDRLSVRRAERAVVESVADAGDPQES